MSDFTQDRWKLIQRLALFAYVNREEDADAKDLYKAIIAAKLLKGFYDECTQCSHVEKAKEETILAIVQYIKSHPRASERDLQQEVEKQINIFVDKIK